MRVLLEMNSFVDDHEEFVKSLAPKVDEGVFEKLKLKRLSSCSDYSITSERTTHCKLLHNQRPHRLYPALRLTGRCGENGAEPEI